MPDSNQDDFPWHLGVFDAHCHPTDTLDSLSKLPQMHTRVMTIMATRAQDQALVANAADEYGINRPCSDISEADWSHKLADKGASTTQTVVPAFGWHPWFSHQMFDESTYGTTSELSVEQKISHYQSVLNPKSEDLDFLRSLPDPRPFRLFLEQTKKYLEKYPLALVGEIGLDKSFRIPEAWLPQQAEQRDDSLTPGGREGRRLSPYRVSIDHQRSVLLAQLRLAGQMARAVSVHGVQAHGLLFDTIAETWKGHEKTILTSKEKKRRNDAAARNAELPDEHETQGETSSSKPYPPRLCLHSFSGPAEIVKQYLAASVPCDVFFSFSTSINNWVDSEDGKVEMAVRAVPDDRILVESDLHTAGDRMDEFLEAAVRKICQVKKWELHAGVLTLKRNWFRFVFGEI